MNHFNFLFRILVHPVKYIKSADCITYDFEKLFRIYRYVCGVIAAGTSLRMYYPKINGSPFHAVFVTLIVTSLSLALAKFGYHLRIYIDEALFHFIGANHVFYDQLRILFLPFILINIVLNFIFFSISAICPIINLKILGSVIFAIHIGMICHYKLKIKNTKMILVFLYLLFSCILSFLPKK